MFKDHRFLLTWWAWQIGTPLQVHSCTDNNSHYTAFKWWAFQLSYNIYYISITVVQCMLPVNVAFQIMRDSMGEWGRMVGGACAFCQTSFLWAGAALSGKVRGHVHINQHINHCSAVQLLVVAECLVWKSKNLWRSLRSRLTSLKWIFCCSSLLTELLCFCLSLVQWMVPRAEACCTMTTTSCCAVKIKSQLLCAWPLTSPLYCHVTLTEVRSSCKSREHIRSDTQTGGKTSMSGTIFLHGNSAWSSP